MAMSFAYPLQVRWSDYWKDKQQFVKPVDNLVYWTMVAVEEGTFNFTINHHSGVATAGDVVVCPPNTDFYREMESPLTFFYITFFHSAHNVEADLVQRLLRDLFAYRFSPAEKDRLLNNYRMMIRLYMTRHPERWQLIHHFVNDIWLLLRLEADSHAPFGRIIHDPVMIEAKRKIEQQAFQPLRMKDIALEANMHPVHFSRRFHSVFGFPPSQFLHTIRMEKAKLLLTQTDYTIDHIARLCGYDNGSYFTRMFSKHTAKNPSQYRNSHSRISP